MKINHNEINHNEIEVNGICYVKKDSVKIETVEWTGENTLASRLIGKNVIVRTRNAGINAGTVVLADETGIELKNSRRIWYHRPKDKSLSWYEGVVVSGIDESSKVSGTVPRKVIIEDYEAVEFKNDEAFNSVMELTPNEQN